MVALSPQLEGRIPPDVMQVSLVSPPARDGDAPVA
jgi:hypothetical protein